MDEAFIKDLVNLPDPKLKHNETIAQLEQVFRNYGFYTTKEYPIFRMKDGSDRSGRIDLVARKGKFRVALEYDHHRLIKYKSFQKIVQIKPELGIAITGSGGLKPNLDRAEKYRGKLTSPLYIISYKDRTFKILEQP